MSRRLPEVFIPFLDSLSFSPVEPDVPPIALVARSVPAITASGSQFLTPAILLYQRNSTDVTLQGFRKTMSSILISANHVATEAIVDAVLGCAVGVGSAGIDRFKFLENIVTRLRKAEVSHFLVLPHSSVADPLRFDGYTFGATDVSILKSRCQRAGSDYADLYSREHEGHLCLLSPTFHHVVIDFLRPMVDLKLGGKAWRELLLNYFTLMSRQHFEYMWAHLDRTQLLSRPFNAAVLDVDALRNDLGRFAHKVTIYLDFSGTNAGYVVPQFQGSTSLQAGPKSPTFSRYMNHREAYRLGEVGDSELGRTMYACAGFCQQAIRFLEASRTDDAALYATICLEYLFSEKQNTADAVCTRTSALTCFRMAASYFEAKKEVRGLYDARSGFVHSGKPVTTVQGERLIAYARETLRSLLVLHLKPENRAPGFLEKWVKDLDFVVSAFEAGRTFEDSFLAEIGIFRE